MGIYRLVNLLATIVVSILMMMDAIAHKTSSALLATVQTILASLIARPHRHRLMQMAATALQIANAILDTAPPATLATQAVLNTSVLALTPMVAIALHLLTVRVGTATPTICANHLAPSLNPHHTQMVVIVQTMMSA